MNNLTVSVWEEKVIIPTYGIGKPDKNPMFFEKRVYQGSSGVVYPNPVIEKIEDEKTDKEYIGLFLENKYLKIMILPELGGRIQMAYDKIKQRHFIYYNQVIKPALVGLTGPWISGGIEFNWPQHHRPSTFEPVDYTLSENSDGSKTVWVNEVEKMFHTKGMAGFTLYPDKAYIEISAKLYNRTGLPQTFLWWANPAVKVNDHYQSVFPPDVNAVFDHGKRDVSDFPIATGTYYKVDYSPGTDISMYKNIPVPTSYMAINSDYDFVGGYEHDSKGGLLHVADHHVSPGKKQWTWGHSDFGQAWDRNLTDEDGPYIELMTGVFTDNQPDFSWLMPYEEKSFTQYFMPYQELGMVKNASKDLLLAADKKGDKLIVKVYATSVHENIKLSLSVKNEVILEQIITVSPELIFNKEVAINSDFDENDLLIKITANEKELLRYEPAANRKNELPQPAKPALSPQEIISTEQLFLTGQHLEQYRHATYNPVDYYEEALFRDPSDIRNNNAMGKWLLSKGQFAKSEEYFRKAIETVTQRNPNPYDSEPYYNLGLCLTFLERDNEAYDAFYKASWSNAWKDSGYFSVALIDLKRGHYEKAFEHICQALDRNRNNSKAWVIKAAAYRKLLLFDSSLQTVNEALKLDRFNLGALFEKTLISKLNNQDDKAKRLTDELLVLSRCDERNLLEYAFDYAAAGLYEEAGDLLEHALKETDTNPMVFYNLGWFSHKAGDYQKAKEWFDKAAVANPYLCFPNRLIEINILQLAFEINSTDAKAHYYLGNLFYDKRQFADAIKCWETSARLDDTFPTVHRNLGIAYFNKQNEAQKALNCYEKAFALDPNDARVLMELDQLYKRLNIVPEQRLKFLEDHLAVTEQRDDTYLERVSLYNFGGDYETALSLIEARKFHPWEGGEGKVSYQYLLSLVQLAKHFIKQKQYEKAIEYLERFQTYPHNLGEGKLYGAQENDIDYWLGCAYARLNKQETANEYFTKATKGLNEPSAAIFYNDQQPDKIFYQGLAHKKLGSNELANTIFNKLVAYGIEHAEDEVKLDYFAVSLPNLLIFDDNLDLRNRIHAYFIQGLGYLGLERTDEAIQMFTRVLEMDAAHSGSKVHLEMVESGF
jgi:tetratricopeptide (TPR) repeat protein